MKITISIVLLWFVSINLSAQRPKKFTPITITGKVIDAITKQPLEYATIVLKHKRTKKISGGITDEKGLFSIQIMKGMYEMSVEFISFKTKKLAAQQLMANKDFGVITLEDAASNLDEVVIIAEKSTVEIRLDKKIFNVGKDMTVKGGNASDVLDNVPSVNVDADGSVSLRGSENVRILIDGKPSALVGLSGTDALRNLPADAIEKVEVITSPSARYDAEGTAGILNIILRKGKITGFNGSLNASVGNPDLVRIAPNINYRTKKINLFTNFGYSSRKGPGNSQSFFTNYENGAIASYRNEDRKFDRKSNGFNSQIGLEYYLSKNSSITGSFFYRNSEGNDIATNITDYLDVSRMITSTENRIENENEDRVNKQYSLNYTNNFDGKGQKLTIDLQYGDSNETEISPITVNGKLNEQNSQITSSIDRLFQIDYVLSIGENSQFEFGQKSTLDDLNSDFKVRDASGTPLLNDPSNAIEFKQHIYAFYSQFGSKVDKFSYLLGLRTEITDIDLTVFTTNQKAEKNYTNIFPTINLGYEITERETITLGFSKRLRRPRSRYLSPFESRSSATNVFRGNPDLNPTFTSSFDLGYNTKIKKVNLGASIYYQYSTDIMQRVSTLEERTISGVLTNIFVRQPINLNDEKRYGFEFTSNFNPSRKARFSLSFNFFNFQTDQFTYTYTAANGVKKDTPFLAVNNSSWFSRFNARITLPGKIQWQTRLMYRGPRNTVQDDQNGIFFTNLSFSKDIFKEKASLVLNVRDLFNSSGRDAVTYIEGRETSNSQFQYRQRQITLSFTYRFNQKKKRQRQSSGGFEEGGGEEYGG